MHPIKPRVFISYSWSSPGHQARIRQWAEQLIQEGVDVELDQWGLKEGHDKYFFMEKIVSDESITHVLIFSDSTYSSKADLRKAGVGAESQIISNEVYSKVQQSKFIPIVCELTELGEPILPKFLQNRIWIDFSSPESANNNWEQLVRVLYGKPAHEKPALGKPPAYVTALTNAPASPGLVKFAALKQAIVLNKPGLKLYRDDFFGACNSYADKLRIRERPDLENHAQRILDDCGKLKHVRDHIVDWVILEASTKPSEEFNDALIFELEQLLELKSKPENLNSWQDSWFDAHSVFVYETFLYVIAALIKASSFETLHLVFHSHYVLPRNGSNKFEPFDAFYGYSDFLQILAPEGKKLNAPAAELVKRQADRSDISFKDLMQAELLALMMSFIVKDARWYPQTLHYAAYEDAFPLFLKATRKRDFQKLAKITGISSADELRSQVKKGQEMLGSHSFHNFWRSGTSFSMLMNMDGLDTL